MLVFDCVEVLDDLTWEVNGLGLERELVGPGKVDSPTFFVLADCEAVEDMQHAVLAYSGVENRYSLVPEVFDVLDFLGCVNAEQVLVQASEAHVLRVTVFVPPAVGIAEYHPFEDMIVEELVQHIHLLQGLPFLVLCQIVGDFNHLLHLVGFFKVFLEGGLGDGEGRVVKRVLRVPRSTYSV